MTPVLISRRVRVSAKWRRAENQERRKVIWLKRQADVSHTPAMDLDGGDRKPCPGCGREPDESRSPNELGLCPVCAVDIAAAQATNDDNPA